MVDEQTVCLICRQKQEIVKNGQQKSQKMTPANMLIIVNKHGMLSIDMKTKVYSMSQGSNLTTKELIPPITPLEELVLY